MSYQSDNMAFNNAMDFLSHYGVKGMEWGKRNEDTLRKYGLLQKKTSVNPFTEDQEPVDITAEESNNMSYDEWYDYLDEHPILKLFFRGGATNPHDRDGYVDRYFSEETGRNKLTEQWNIPHGRDGKRYQMRSLEDIAEMDSKITSDKKAAENSGFEQLYNKTVDKYKEVMTDYIKKKLRGSGTQGSNGNWYSSSSSFLRAD